jgi:hypothetical protein
VSTALKHFLEQTATRELPNFETWFPPCFDWHRLCADVPTMAEKSGTPLPPEEGDEHELESMARSFFKAGHLFTLIVLAAGSAEEGDPERLADHVTDPPSDEEEDAFEALVEQNLQPAERMLAGEEVACGEDGARAVALVGATWPAVEQVFLADPSRMLERAGPAAGLLGGIARLGALLAAFRWLAAEATEEEWPRLGLSE